MPAPITDAQREQIVTLHRQGKTRNAIAREAGVSPSTVSKICTEDGLTFDRTKTLHATRARQADNKSRRASIVHRLYGQAEKILGDLEGEEFRTMVKAAGGADVEETLGFVPPNDRKTLVQTIGSAMTSAVNLEKVDADNGQSAAAVDQWLEMMTGGLRGSPPAGG